MSADLPERMDEFERRLSEATNQHRSALERIESFLMEQRKTIAAVQRTVGTLATREDAKTRQLGAFKEELGASISGLGLEREALVSDLNTLRQRVEDLQGSVKPLGEAVEDLRESNRKLQRSVKPLGEAVEDLRESNKKLETGQTFVTNMFSAMMQLPRPRVQHQAGADSVLGGWGMYHSD